MQLATTIFPFLAIFVCSHSQLVSPQAPPLPSSDNTPTLDVPNTLGLRCLQTITRYERPRTESCAIALTQMPSDTRQQEFRHGNLLPFVTEADNCILRVHGPLASEPAQTSWQYLQTAATQLMVGCLRVYDSINVRTGGVIRVGRRGAFVEISLSKGSAPSLGDLNNVTRGNAVVSDD